MQKVLAVVRRRAFLGSIVTVGTLAGIAAPSMATATYDVSPVVNGLTADLTANIPVILTAVGALIALGIAVRMVRKFVKA